MLNVTDIAVVHAEVIILWKDSCNVPMLQIFCCSLTCISMPVAHEVPWLHMLIICWQSFPFLPCRIYSVHHI